MENLKRLGWKPMVKRLFAVASQTRYLSSFIFWSTGSRFAFIIPLLSSLLSCTNKQRFCIYNCGDKMSEWDSCSWHNFKGKFDTWQKCSWCLFCTGFQLLVRSKGWHNAIFETGSRISSHALRWCTGIYRGICLLSPLGRVGFQPLWSLLCWGSELQSTHGANRARPVLGTPDGGCHYVYLYGRRVFNTLLAYPPYPQTIEETLNHRHFCFPQLE